MVLRDDRRRESGRWNSLVKLRETETRGKELKTLEEIKGIGAKGDKKLVPLWEEPVLAKRSVAHLWMVKTSEIVLVIC